MQGDAHLEEWEKDDVDVDDFLLDWALWYILAGLKDKVSSSPSLRATPPPLQEANLAFPRSLQLSIYTSDQLTTSPFPLPIESFFGLPTSNSATASDFRAAPRSRETS